MAACIRLALAQQARGVPFHGSLTAASPLLKLEGQRLGSFLPLLAYLASAPGEQDKALHACMYRCMRQAGSTRVP